jgi:hypothetical protein
MFIYQKKGKILQRQGDDYVDEKEEFNGRAN